MRTLTILTLVTFIILGLGALPKENNFVHPFWLNELSDPRFPSSKECKDCHGSDPDRISSTTSSGEDVNVYDDWKYSMKALASQDPYWKAQIAYEELVGGDSAISDCFRCHVPSAFQKAKLEGQSLTLENLDSIHQANEGVNCVSCHQIEDFNHFNGLHTYSDSGVIKGPYPNPFTGPMEDLYGWPVEYDPIMRSSIACKSCHTIIHDREGKIVPEQTTYLEWKNSDFQKQQEECQQCHMPYILEPIKLASEYPFLEGRIPFAQHSFLGSNIFMIEAIINELGEKDSTQNISQWNSVRQEKVDFLKGSADISLIHIKEEADSIKLDLKIENNSGHKLPTGYPSRKLVFTIKIIGDHQDTILSTPDPYHLNWSEFYPHRNQIFEDNHVQLYEYIAHNSNGVEDYSLHNAHSIIKDNRILPQGFIQNDTIAIKGIALNDPSYLDKSGSDLLHIKVAKSNYQSISVSAELWYVLASPPWLNALQNSGLDISNRLNDYLIDRPPYQKIDSLNFEHLLVNTNQSIKTPFRVFPNPANINQTVHIEGLDAQQLSKALLIQPNGQTEQLNLTAPFIPGSYLKQKGVYYLFIKGKALQLIVQ